MNAGTPTFPSRIPKSGPARPPPSRWLLRPAMETSRSQGWRQRGSMLCRSSSEATPSVCRAALPRGRQGHRARRPLCSSGAAPHMDLESASLLLMSTSKSLSFALMCLYSLYSSAIGVRSSFWTFLTETKDRGLRIIGRLLDDAVQRARYQRKHAAYQPVASVWPSAPGGQAWSWA